MSWLGKCLRTMMALSAAVLLLVAGLWALAHNGAATAHFLPYLPGITVHAPQGALLGDFKAQGLQIKLPRGGSIVLTDPSWVALRIQPDWAAPWHVKIDMDRLSANRMTLIWVPDPATTPTVVPTDLSLPVAVNIGRLQLAEVRSALWGDTPLLALDAALSLQATLQTTQQQRGVHRLTLAHLQWQGWTLSGDASLGVTGKLPLTAKLSARGSPDAKASAQAQAEVTVQGPLASLVMRGQVSWQRMGAAKQALMLDADLAPFSLWPVTRLQAQGHGLNLSDLDLSLPQTALHGEVLVVPVGQHDVRVQMAVRNEQAGTWDGHRLPVKRLQGHLTLLGARAAKTMQGLWHVGSADVVAQLPSAKPSLAPSATASLHVEGGWGASENLRVEWQGLQPQALHGRAPPLNLQGNMQIDATQSRVTGQAQGFYTLADSSTLPVKLSLSGQYAPGQFRVSALTLRAKDAQADLKNTQLRWGGQPSWQVQGQLRVSDFDPQVWLPWPAQVKGRNQLSGLFDINLDAGWRGDIKADMAPSLLGGVPLHGHAQWRSPRSSQLMSVGIDFDVGGNKVQGQGEVPWRLDPHGVLRWGQEAHWSGQVHAPDLQGLQPLAPLLGARQVSGLIEAQGTAHGVWPLMTTDGQLKISKLQWVNANGTPLKLMSAKGDWRIDTRAADAPARVRIDVQQGQLAKVQLDQALLTLDGSVRDHTAHLTADVGLKQRLDSKAMPFHVALNVHGGLQTLAGTWRGRFSDVLLSKGGTTPQVLLQALPFDVSWVQNDQGRQLKVGSVNLGLIGSEMKLQKLDWQWTNLADDPVGEVDMTLQLLPLNLPALLARWQPDMGWSGDMMLSGQVHLRHSLKQPWVVDADVTRQSGDIALSEPTIVGNSTQRLGIRDARVTLQARDGIWTVRENFDGRILGVLKGSQVVKASRPDQLPAASDALVGELDLQIGSLRALGGWAPAGWRVTGQMQAQASIAGTLGAPQYHGQVLGQNLGLAQALMGVNLTDGVLQMVLQGDRIDLTQLTAKSGLQGGSLSAKGQVRLGDQPEAHLAITAERFGLLQRVDRRVVVSGEAQASLTEQDIKVDGQLMVNEGLIDITRSDAPTIADDVNVVNRPGQDPDDQVEAAAANGPKRKLTTNLSVDLGHQLRLKGKGLDGFLTGALRVTTPANKPAVHGTVRVEGGTYAAYGQKLVIERGAIAFNGPIENPRLDILAMRPQSPTALASDVKVGVNIAGTAQDPRVRLYSDPAMSETEKLSWLVLGRGPTGLGGADLGLLQSAAVALLSGEGASPTDNLIGALGLDELSVRQTDGAVRDTVVNLGKQVSKFWYVGYERNLTATSGNWQLIYSLAQRLTVRAQAGDDNAVDFILSWRWD